VAKNFPKVANFWKVMLQFMAFLLENAKNTEGPLLIIGDKLLQKNCCH
jgi:hypothetical protein